MYFRDTKVYFIEINDIMNNSENQKIFRIRLHLTENLQKLPNSPIFKTKSKYYYFKKKIDFLQIYYIVYILYSFIYSKIYFRVFYGLSSQNSKGRKADQSIFLC